MADTPDMGDIEVRSGPRIGDVIDGRYELRRDLGQGAAGRVFEAVHQFTGRSVALKISAATGPEKMREEFRARLKREARALASLRHPGIVEILDGGFLPDGAPYLVLELLDGRTLEGLIAARGRVSPDDAVAFALQLCDSLDAAHAVGIVHRDVKPSNILIVHDHAGHEVIKLLDFGIARVDSARAEKLTGIGALIGTPAYMSPEQLLALDDVDKRSDVYALGVTLFECLTGRMPYEGNYQTVLLHVCSPEPVPSVGDLEPSIPMALVDIVKQAMSKERNDRFPTMKELKRALRTSLLSTRAQTYFFCRPPSHEASPPTAQPAQRRKLVRAPYVTPVHLMVGDISIDGRTEDISTGGLLVICHQNLPDGRASDDPLRAPHRGDRRHARRPCPMGACCPGGRPRGTTRHRRPVHRPVGRYDGVNRTLREVHDRA